MAREFRLPDIGEGLTEAEILRWIVPVGESVEADQPVVEVETDKAVVEIPSPFAGVVLHHGAEEGEVVEVGQVLLVVGEEGEPWPERTPASESALPLVRTLAEEADGAGESWQARPDGVQALPQVRRLARELGVELERVEGTGPRGRITREDVLAAADAPDAPEAQATVPVEPLPALGGTLAPPGSAPPSGHEERPPSSGAGARRPLSAVRRTIAANMSRAWAEIPHVTTFDEVDATRLLAAWGALRDRHGVPIPLESLVVKAVIPALERFPELAARLEGAEELVFPSAHHIGVAVDTPDGLVVVVVRDAGALGLLQLAAEIRRLAEGARQRTLSPEEMAGQTFTVSNIGAVGGGHGTPIVPPGTVAILSVGRATERPVARGGRVGVAPLMPLSLSYDHRVVDGALGRRFMAVLLENLEEPALFLAS